MGTSLGNNLLSQVAPSHAPVPVHLTSTQGLLESRLLGELCMEMQGKQDGGSAPQPGRIGPYMDRLLRRGAARGRPRLKDLKAKGIV